MSEKPQIGIMESIVNELKSIDAELLEQKEKTVDLTKKIQEAIQAKKPEIAAHHNEELRKVRKLTRHLRESREKLLQKQLTQKEEGNKQEEKGWGFADEGSEAGEVTPPKISKENKTSPYAGAEVAKFVKEFDLISLLPKEFNKLDDNQKLKVTEDLKKRIVDIVKEDAQTQYSEEYREKNRIGKMRASINKESEIKNLEKTVFEEFISSKMGKKIIAENLDILSTKTANQDIYLIDGKPNIRFFTPQEGSSVEVFKLAANFNKKANEFTKIPYESGQEKSGKRKKEYEKIKAEYEKAREDLLGSTPTEDIGKELLLDVLQIDNAVQMEQLLNTHPEVEKEFSNLKKSAGKSEYKKDVTNFLSVLKGGKGKTNSLLFAGGYVARMGVRALTASTPMGWLYLGGSTIAGGVIGGLKARFRAKNALEEKQKQARHGQKDTSRERVAITDATNLSKHLEKLLEEIKNATTDEERIKNLALLTPRIEHTQGKIEKGQVNFGDAKSLAVNQFNLVNNLNKALVLREMVSKKTDAKLSKDIEKIQKSISHRLMVRGENIAKDVSTAQKKYVWGKAKWGFIYGAGFATAGYALRYIEEHAGEWWHGTQMSGPAQTPAIGADHATATSHILNPSVNSAPGQVVSTPTPEILKAESITFDHGKGAIQGILDLKRQIRGYYHDHYHDDFSHAPKSVQDFMRETNVAKQAQQLGFFKPNDPNGAESAMILKGSTLGFDEHGNMIFHEARGGNTILIHGEGKTFVGPEEKFHGKMFDSDHSEHPAAKMNPEEYLREEGVHPRTLEEALGNREHGIEAGVQPRTLAEALGETKQENEFGVQPRTIGDALEHKTAGYPEVPIDKQGHAEFAFEQKGFFSSHPEFVQNNHYHLTEAKLIQAYEASRKNLNIVFEHDQPDQWERLKNLKVNYLLDNANSSNPVQNHLSNYLIELKKYVRPHGWIRGRETAENYIARALQKITADGKLEKFQANFRT